jgi:cytochrome c peroxidase
LLQTIEHDQERHASGKHDRTEPLAAGDPRALSERARSGLATFLTVGCTTCHNGVGVGGGMYQKFGLAKPYWVETGSAVVDSGRYIVTKNPDDLFVFKVPTLRNVAMTPPYFHDGSVATLPAAVRTMARVQLGRELSEGEIDDIVAFLRDLTGPLPDDFAHVPTLKAAFVP